MHRKRTELFADKYYPDPQSFGRKITDAETGAVIRYGDDLLSAYVTLSKDNDIEYGIIDENIELPAEKGSEAGEVLIAKGVQLEKGCDGSYDMT